MRRGRAEAILPVWGGALSDAGAYGTAAEEGTSSPEGPEVKQADLNVLLMSLKLSLPFPAVEAAALKSALWFLGIRMEAGIVLYPSTLVCARHISKCRGGGHEFPMAPPLADDLPLLKGPAWFLISSPSSGALPFLQVSWNRAGGQFSSCELWDIGLSGTGTQPFSVAGHPGTCHKGGTVMSHT